MSVYELCDDVTDPNLGPTCGRPFGFSFNNFNGVLYIVDAFLGLFKVGPEGGLATLIAKSAGGVPFKFLNGIDVDQLTGDVYLTDASQTFDLRNVIQGNYVLDSTGRLIKYNPITKELKVLLDGLSIPAGPVVSTDRTFVLFSEFSTKTVKKYCLTGLKANTTEALLNLPGNPVKIKRAPEPGKFWVAVNEIVQQQQRNATPFGYKFDSFGEILLIKNLEDYYSNIIVNLVQEYNGGRVFVGSREVKFVGMYSK
ncbi:protein STRICTOSIDINE SYNTHASE-LIKE 11-like [Coffea eugenioides]|uniref:protein STRICTOSIDINE SYNTHASE-LIKE 11-like n=1 Tax=Coffea eugenioides TaxID=49369 RepID=UPI000F60A099|nr:protein STRICTOSIDINE SYNTHASE-LIKE 11-like [Coffea eugenioides]